ncbi:cation-transporting P-type ATPase [Micromonospora sp. PLK6-60]|uniref:cation-translocating P-type ATPase n=1 Tax=Micromonospora sp. PLK6-60 TaxID=2873383 RepID=UPI001CA791F2|nr:cation-transporting P-type ATPase [Micromonospora sp. PLK6-60]MBY8870572.1 cation-transporting P-type ATPase [Micromonospora sp. PLK6-60]
MSVELEDPRVERGLTSAHAGDLLRTAGPNTVTAARPRRLVSRIARQLGDPLVLLLLAAAVVTTVLGDYPDTAVIALVVLLNTVIGLVQEIRADTAVDALDRLAAPTARVVRDGHDVVVPAAEVVPGDLVRLEVGDVVPADLRLTDAVRLRLDESALTGESIAVGRVTGEEAYAGTVVVTGRATGVVTGTGSDSALGKIATLVASTRPAPTPLQRRLAGLGRTLGAAAVGLAGVVLVLGLVAGRPLPDMAVTAVSLVVAAVPESLPAVVTLALALGARRMAAARAIPRRLHAVETLGSVTVIASDKTGTLTEGRMAVQRVVTPDGAEFDVTGDGYAPHGVIRRAGETVVASDDLRRLAEAALLCNDATLAAPTQERPHWSAVGDPLEAALVSFAARAGLDVAAVRAARPRITERPFDQDTRRMVTVHRIGDDEYLVACKGAPENVLAAPLVAAHPETVARLVAAADALASDGWRVLAIAAATTRTAPDPGCPVALRPLGLVGLGDPIRAGAPAVAAAFDRAQVRMLLITGDHPAVAAAIGNRLGIWRAGDPVLTGAELQDGRANADPAAGGVLDAEQADRVRVFARIQPEQKLDIIAGLQARGHVVAMTGDGVNDAPALRRADIGVAMGGGTEVARQASDLVLVDDNLDTIAAAIGEGRRIYDNIRRFLRYALSGGLAEIAVMLVGPFLGLAVPLLPAQILWVNLLTHGLPGVALGAEPAEHGVLRRPPRSGRHSVLGGGLTRQILVTGGLIAAVVLAAGTAAHQLGRPWQTITFVVLGLAQLGVALAVRARPAPGTPSNRGLLAAVALSVALQLLAVLAPPLRALLGVDPLGLVELAACVAVAAIPGLALSLARQLSKPGRHRRSRRGGRR